MGIKTMIGKVLVKTGVFTDPDYPKREFRTLADAQKRDAECGCGLDCCDNELVMKDKTTGNVTKLYFLNGVMKFQIIDGDENPIYTVTAVAD